MKEEKNLYESPKVEAMEIIVEQAILTASGADVSPYPGWGGEEPL